MGFVIENIDIGRQGICLPFDLYDYKLRFIAKFGKKSDKKLVWSRKNPNISLQTCDLPPIQHSRLQNLDLVKSSKK